MLWTKDHYLIYCDNKNEQFWVKIYFRENDKLRFENLFNLQKKIKDKPDYFLVNQEFIKFKFQDD